VKAEELAGKTAIVSGAASGIGAAVSRLFVAEGARVVMVDRDAAGLADTAAQIEGSSSTCALVTGDVTDPRTAEGAVSAALDRFRGLHILVNNAGVALTGAITETSPSQWESVFATNVRSAYLLSRQAIPPMSEGGGGTIVMVASEAGLVGFPRYAAYSASKAALINLSRSMALDHAPDGIRVNCVCPGSIETPLLRAFYDAQADPQKARLEDQADHPLGIGQPEDIADAVLFLVSDRSRYVTGHALVVDGGYTAK
jgi:2-keto-3-deoxy-L-fuconate dehydrogenase